MGAKLAFVLLVFLAIVSVEGVKKKRAKYIKEDVKYLRW